MRHSESVTSLSAETGQQITVLDVIPVAERHLAAAFGAASVGRVDNLPGRIRRQPPSGAAGRPAGARRVSRAGAGGNGENQIPARPARRWLCAGPART